MTNFETITASMTSTSRRSTPFAAGHTEAAKASGESATNRYMRLALTISSIHTITAAITATRPMTTVEKPPVSRCAPVPNPSRNFRA